MPVKSIQSSTAPVAVCPGLPPLWRAVAAPGLPAPTHGLHSAGRGQQTESRPGSARLGPAATASRAGRAEPRPCRARAVPSLWRPGPAHLPWPRAAPAAAPEAIAPCPPRPARALPEPLPRQRAVTAMAARKRRGKHGPGGSPGSARSPPGQGSRAGPRSPSGRPSPLPTRPRHCRPGRGAVPAPQRTQSRPSRHGQQGHGCFSSWALCCFYCHNLPTDSPLVCVSGSPSPRVSGFAWL